MVGTYVRGTGKCSDCGDWYYTKEKGSDGRWIPELNQNGTQIVNSYGKAQWKQHIHDCGGSSGAAKATHFEKQLTTLAEDVDVTRHTNMKNVFSLAADMAIMRSKVDNIEKDTEKIKMDLETFLRTISKSWYTPANKLEVDDKQPIDNDSDIAEEISDTDDKTSLDSHSVNFVDPEQDER